jgi:tRNA pseudouridine(55) synthase
MQIFNKKVGETPLQMLDRFRIEQPEFSDSKLSYAGRLDPMAQGQTIILVDEENKDYKKYLGYDKEYVATFLIGVETDTGDALGLITNVDFEFIPDQILLDQIINFAKVKKQKYPWFSSKTVNGLKLFDHFKQGNFDIERPSRDVDIKSVDDIVVSEISAAELKDYIFENIKKVTGDFRQTETLQKWQEFFTDTDLPKTFQIVQCRLNVSTGTYIRALTEKINQPALLLKLNRTKIHIN